MRVLVAGDRGYIGAVPVRALRAASHEVDGLDLGLCEGCDLGPAIPEASAAIALASCMRRMTVTPQGGTRGS